MPSPRLSMSPASWHELAIVVEEMTSTDDPRLADLVVGLEAELGCSLGDPDRSAAMMGRRFARAQRMGAHEAPPAIAGAIAAH